MTDTADTPAPLPIVADESPWPGLLAVLFRYGSVGASCVVAFVGLAGHHNFIGAVEYIQSDAAKPGLAALAAIATAGWGAWHQWQAHRRVLAFKAVAPDHVALIPFLSRLRAAFSGSPK